MKKSNFSIKAISLLILMAFATAWFIACQKESTPSQEQQIEAIKSKMAAGDPLDYSSIPAEFIPELVKSQSSAAVPCPCTNPACPGPTVSFKVTKLTLNNPNSTWALDVKRFCNQNPGPYTPCMTVNNPQLNVVYTFPTAGPISVYHLVGLFYTPNIGSAAGIQWRIGTGAWQNVIFTPTNSTQTIGISSNCE